MPEQYGIFLERVLAQLRTPEQCVKDYISPDERRRYKWFQGKMLRENLNRFSEELLEASKHNQ